MNTCIKKVGDFLMKDIEFIRKIIEQNNHKQFVKRILNRNNYKPLDNNDGTHSTHAMEWVDVDNGRAVAFPTVLVNSNNELQRFSTKDAIKHTQKTGNYIRFDNKADAAYFSKNYKLIWGSNDSKY